MRICTKHYPSGAMEKRDALAQDWYTFLKAVLPKTLCIPIPNIGKHAVNIVKDLNINGLILTGGNDLNTEPLRDITEESLLDFALQQNLPVLGVCRGAQMLNAFLGGKLKPLSKNHLAQRHHINIQGNELSVNSYHEYGFFAKDLAEGLIPIATAEDQSIEAFRHTTNPWLGLMWHPERETNHAKWDCEQIQSLFKEI